MAASPRAMSLLIWKGRLRLRHRVVIVLLSAANKEWVSRLASDDPSSWRYPFYVHLNHPAMGAVLVQEAGCSPLSRTCSRPCGVRASAWRSGATGPM